MKVLHDPTHNPTDQSAYINPDELDASAKKLKAHDKVTERMKAMSSSEPSSRRIFLKQVTGASGALGVGAAAALLPAGAARGVVLSRAARSIPMLDNTITSRLASAGGNEPMSEFVVRHIPLIPLLSLLIIAGNFFIFFALFT